MVGDYLNDFDEEDEYGSGEVREITYVVAS